jgi:hypothetical protein
MLSPKNGNNTFRDILFSFSYDVLVLNMIFLNMSHCALRPQILLWSPGGRKGVNPRHVVRNFFLLKLVTLAELQISYRNNKTK